MTQPGDGTEEMPFFRPWLYTYPAGVDPEYNPEDCTSICLGDNRFETTANHNHMRE